MRIQTILLRRAPRLPALLLAGLLAGLPAADLGAAQVYRTVDEEGNVVYTDRPPPGAPGQEPARAVELPEANTMPPPQVPARSARQYVLGEEGSGEGQPTPSYEVRIVAPAPEETLRSNNGQVTVRVRVDPPLAGGHGLVLTMDGTRVGGDVTDGFAQLVGVDRGAHELLARVVDEDGTTLATSVTVTFYLHQASRLIPRGPD